MFLRNSVTLIYTADFLYNNITPKYTAALHLCSYAAALRLFMQQHYTCIRSSVTHICVAVLFMQQRITPIYTAVLLTQQHYTYAHSITLISAAALHTSTPQRSTHIHSNSITYTNTTK